MHLKRTQHFKSLYTNKKISLSKKKKKNVYKSWEKKESMVSRECENDSIVWEPHWLIFYTCSFQPTQLLEFN